MSDEQKKRNAKLISSATLSNFEGVKKALEEDATPNAADDNGWTALYWALTQSFAKIEVVDLLLSKGANPNAVTDDGETALTVALSKGHAEIAKLLLSKGAKGEKTDLDTVGKKWSNSQTEEEEEKWREIFLLLKGWK